MEAWILQHFFNPTFVAGGAALIASPIVIHLINRLRYRRVRFAAMEFLLQSEQRNRRRILFEQLLLLLLRILIVLAIVALIARLILDPSQLSIFRGARIHHVVLLDDSGSMRDRWGETTAFQESLDVVQRLVAEGARRPETQRFSLLLMTKPDEPVVADRDVNEAFLRELETTLENLECSQQTVQLPAGLNAAAKYLSAEPTGVRQLHVVSDFRKRDWQDSKAISEVVRALSSTGVTVNLVKTVSDQHANLAISSLSGAVQVAAIGVPMRLTVGVRNFGDTEAQDVRVSLFDNDAKLPVSIVFEKIPAGEEVTHEADVRFSEPGAHRLKALLSEDALPIDDARFLAVNVSEAVRVLIIDGNPESDESLFVADALAADPAATGVSPTIEPVDFLRRRSLEEFSCIYILEVPVLPADAIAPLERYTASGGGLVWFVGPAVRPPFYRETLYQDGAGLFPIPLGPVSAMLRPDPTLPGPDVAISDHPVFRVLSGQDNPFVDSVRVSEYLPPDDAWASDDRRRGDGVTTLAMLRNGDPLLVEKAYGKGRIVACLTTAGPRWNSWPLNPSYVPFQLDLQKHVARTDRNLPSRIVGEEIDIRLDPARYTEDVEIALPVEAGGVVSRLQAAPERDGSDDAPLVLAAKYRETQIPGIYSVGLLDQNQIREQRLIAYNAPPEESRLDLASSDELRKGVGEDAEVQIREPGSVDWVEGKSAGEDVRFALLVLLVTAMLAEQWLAYRMGYHAVPAGARA